MKSIVSKKAVLAAVLCSASAWAATPDGLITSSTKLALWTTGGVKSTAVHVDTNDGVVTLYGKVPSVEQKATAEKATKDVKGVREVKNLLQVVAEINAKQVERADKEIKAQVEKALKADASLKDSSISVKSVDKGVVLLNGKAATYSDQLSAVSDADCVVGVHRVATEIESPEYGSEDRVVFLTTKANPAGKTATSPVSNSLTDTRITAAVKLRLLTTANIPSSEINVDTTGRVVTLFGIVSTEAAKSGAAGEAAKVSDVRKVQNDLQVVPTAQKELVEANDKDLKESLKLAFKDRPELKDVSGEVKNGMIRLTGTVDSGWDRLLAVRLARHLAGAKAVEEQLVIRAEAEAKHSER